MPLFAAFHFSGKDSLNVTLDPFADCFKDSASRDPKKKLGGRLAKKDIIWQQKNILGQHFLLILETQ